MNVAGCCVIAVALITLAWHAVSEHYTHLRLLRLIRPNTRVPVTDHDAWWHELAWWWRYAIQAALLIFAVTIALAYRANPDAVTIAGAVGVTAVLILLAVRRHVRRQA